MGAYDVPERDLIATLPSPADLGFPEKFASWRPDQVHAIDRTIRSKKRFIGAVAPTGFGKTLYGVAISLLTPEVNRALYLTSSKGLQDQIGSEFHALGLVDVRGQRNYPCDAIESTGQLTKYRRHRGYVGCDSGPCHAGVRCGLAPDKQTPYVRPACKYYGAVFDARESNLVSTNYAMHFAAGAYSQGLGDFDLIILDEAHDADKQLEAFLSFEITSDDLNVLRGKNLESAELADWKKWADHHFFKLASQIEQRELMPPDNSEGVQEMRKLKAVLGKLGRLRDIAPGDWILELDRTAKFSPLKVSKYAEEHLFRKAKKVILTSATLTRKTLQLLGIPLEESELLEFKSSFPINRRPVIAVETTPSVTVNVRMHDSTKHLWMRRIDRLIDSRRDRKGIIHTVSYARMKDLYAASEHRDLMMTHEPGNTLTTIRAFKEHIGPCILVSPSVVTGYDFPGDECRYQIIGKVPIPDMRGRINEIRNQTDKELKYYLAMQALVQACGRGMRSADDWCETLIIDDTFGTWFWQRARKHAPKWFSEAIDYVDSYPEPLNF
jgi:ATP-dependent DNA helicase DinG